jgi:hypothetical protein
LYGPGFEARDRWIGIAAELDETPEGFALATRADGAEEVLSVGLLVQSEANFYRPLVERGYRRGDVLAVRKRGRGKETRYEFRRIASDGVEVRPDSPPTSTRSSTASPTSTRCAPSSTPCPSTGVSSAGSAGEPERAWPPLAQRSRSIPGGRLRAGGPEVATQVP